MITIPKASPAPRIQRISVNDWLKGYNSNLDEGRTPIGGLRRASNVLLDQDGTVGPRKSLVEYGEQPTGTVLGQVYEFVDNTTSTPVRKLICMQVLAGVGKVTVSEDGGAWAVKTGKTYDDTAKAHFVQVDNKVMVMNGVDNLSYYDIPTDTVVPFVQLTTPSAPTLSVGANIVGTNFPIRYRVTASNSGETAASVAGTSTTLRTRDTWVGVTGGATEYIDVTITRVTGATRYNIYVGETTGTEAFIESVPDPGSGTTFVYRDLGSAPRDVTRFAPLSDTTEGPKVTRGEVVNGRLWLTGDTDNPSRVYYGGDTGSNAISFSPYEGGGWLEVGKGTKEYPVRVIGFRNPQGTPIVTVLCNGAGKRYILTPDTTTVGDFTIAFFNVEEANGADGTDSPDGVVLHNDSLWYPSRDGFKTTGTKPQLQNVLSTDLVSESIQNDYVNLRTTSMDRCVGLAYQGRIYWALPVGTSTNNQIWVLDTQRKGAWMLPMSVSADWMWLYTDSDGATRHLVLQDNKILQFTSSQSTSDDGTAFGTNITSGFIKFSDDAGDWARVIDVTFVFLRPKGDIQVSVAGKTEDSSLSTLATGSFDSNISVAGWGEGDFDGNTLGWSETVSVPTEYGNAREQVVIEVDEDMKWLTYQVKSDDMGVEYQLSDCIIRYVDIGWIEED